MGGSPMRQPGFLQLCCNSPSDRSGRRPTPRFILEIGQRRSSRTQAADFKSFSRESLKRSGYRRASRRPRPRSAPCGISRGRRSTRCRESPRHRRPANGEFGARVISASAASTSVSGSTVIAGELITRRHRPVERLGAMVAQAIDDVALRHDAGDPAVLDDRKGADPFLAEPPHRIGQRRRQRSFRRAALALEHCCDGHGLPPELAAVGLIVPLRAAKGKPCPHDPVPSPRHR